MTDSPWFLKLSHRGANCTPRDAALQLREIADRLVIPVEGEINDETWCADPGQAPYRIAPGYLTLADKDSEAVGDRH